MVVVDEVVVEVGPVVDVVDAGGSVGLDGVDVAVDTSTGSLSAGSLIAGSAPGSDAAGPADMPPLCVVLQAVRVANSASTMTPAASLFRLKLVRRATTANVPKPEANFRSCPGESTADRSEAVAEDRRTEQQHHRHRDRRAVGDTMVSPLTHPRANAGPLRLPRAVARISTMPITGIGLSATASAAGSIEPIACGSTRRQ